MSRICVVSPHCDDAVFSLGEYMLAWVEDGHELTVFTVFAGVPDDLAGRRKHTTLHVEHHRAMRALGARGYMANLLDSVYPPRPPVGEVAEVIDHALSSILPDIVIAPWGIHHDDHILTRQAVLHCSHQKTLLFYDEIPYYVQYPEQACQDGTAAPLGFRSSLLGKQALCSFYASQIDDELKRMLFVPERLWS